MPNTVLGKVSVTPKGAWSGSSSYEKLDIVSNGGNSYIALQNVPAGTALSNSSYWLMIAQKGDKGNTGEITGASASISGGYGTPSVSVTSGGTSTDRSFAFAFSNLKGNGISAVNCEKTGTSGAVDTYTLTISEDDGTVNTFALEVTNGSVTSVNGRTGAVTGLAEDNGYYEDMTVGGAEQLISSTYVEDSVPYVFRTSGGSADIGDREFDEIHGGTIAWNQLIEKGNMTDGWYFSDSSGSYANNILTFTASAQNGYVRPSLPRAIVSGHKYLGLVDIKATTSGSVRILFISGNDAKIDLTTTTSWTTYGVIWSNASTENSYYPRIYDRRASGWDAIQIRNCMLIDLTQMFGSTIADYIYSLEQSNTGSGVAWFKSLFPKPYYAYNAGELISVSGLSAHKTTGFNQLDASAITWTNGIRDDNGNITTGQSHFTNAIRVLPDTQYEISGTLRTNFSTFRIYYLDANEGWISRTESVSTDAYEFTTPTNCGFIQVQVTGGINNLNDVCLHLVWDGERNGEYEPYESSSYALDSDVTLRGIPKLDADNKLYYDGDVYASDGSVERRYGIVDLGTLTWGLQTSGSVVAPFYYADYSGIAYKGNPALVRANALCAKYPVGVRSATSFIDKTICVDGNSSTGVIVQIQIKDSSYETASALKSALSGVYFVYELATPTTESAEPYTTIQQVSNWGTEEYVIAEQSGVALPVGHLTRYTQDLKAKLEMAPQSPSAGNGDYVVRQTNGINTYVPLTERIPNAPSENGNYILKCTVNGSTVTYVWESAT